MEEDEIGSGIPPEGEPVTLSEALRLLKERKAGEERYRYMLQHCEKFGKPVHVEGQLGKVRREVFGALEGYQNVAAPRLPPSVEAAMLVDLVPTLEAETLEIVPGFPERRRAGSGGLPPDGLLDVLKRAGLCRGAAGRS